MARLLDALMHPVSQMMLLIGIVGLSIFLIFRPPPLPTRPVAVQITPIAGGMRVPAAPRTVPLASQPPVQPNRQPTLTVDSASATSQAVQPFELAALTPTTPIPTTPTAAATVPTARSALSVLPKLRNGPVCACDGDRYSCRELGDQAQACFDYCVARGQGDVHRLDFNQNGVACEE